MFLFKSALAFAIGIVLLCFSLKGQPNQNLRIETNGTSFELLLDSKQNARTNDSPVFCDTVWVSPGLKFQTFKYAPGIDESIVSISFIHDHSAIAVTLTEESNNVPFSDQLRLGGGLVIMVDVSSKKEVPVPVKVYPYPAKSGSDISLQNLPQGSCLIEIRNTQGITMKTVNIKHSNQDFTFNVGHLSPGVYTLGIKNQRNSSCEVMVLHILN